MTLFITYSTYCDTSFYESAIAILGVIVATLSIFFSFIVVFQAFNYSKFKKKMNQQLEFTISKINIENQEFKVKQDGFVKACVNVANGNISISEKKYDEAIISLITAMKGFYHIEDVARVEELMFVCLDITREHDKDLKKSHEISRSIDIIIQNLSQIPSEIGGELYAYFTNLKTEQADKVRRNAKDNLNP